MKDMVKICPKDDLGKKTYAVSLWSAWDDAMVMYVKGTATAYYGYDELGIGLYDSATGKLHDALEENGPYLEMLKFYNDLYQEGLLDPDSRTQKYDDMINKARRGATMFSIYNYAGAVAYNKEIHTEKNKMMHCLMPEEATPMVYGISPQGGDHIWTIGAKTEYPELCMKVINYLSTPEGRLTTEYGPKGLCWDYDDKGNTYFTELGKKCNADVSTKIGSGYKGTFIDGTLKIATNTWSLDASNPESNGETYNSENWKSNLLEAETSIEKDWQKVTKSTSINDYMEKRSYVVSMANYYSPSGKSDDLESIWSRVTDEIKSSSWDAIYAESDAEYNRIVKNMVKKCQKLGYDECVSWSVNEASKRKSLEETLTK